VHPRSRLVLATTTLAHFVHDGFSDILYVLLPVWARDFHLVYAQVGIIRLLYTGSMALSQIPAGLSAERRGERGLLVAGTALTACGFMAAAGWAGGFASLAAFLIVAGLGSGVQHPLASSLVSKAYETGARRAALGTYNFSGDLGKIAAAAAAGLGVAAFGWRVTTAGYGALGLVAAGAVGLGLLRLGAGDPDPVAARPHREDRGWGIRDSRGFVALAAVGLIDSGTRSGFLTFLPFALVAKGSSPAGIGGALALVFAGGAAGKLICGLLAERIGVVRTVVITEVATAVGIVATVAAPPAVTLLILIPLGVALNGTSSVLYATVADLVVPARRSRAYGLYYTVAIGASAVAPFIYGIMGDLVGVPATLVVIAAVGLATLPLCVALRPVIAAAGRAA
jgi:FSR family fosmidomycin resistance protein-like MFS transporter